MKQKDAKRRQGHEDTGHRTKGDNTKDAKEEP